MADKLVPSQDDTGAIRRFRDMGDGTWAEVTSPAAGAAGAASYPAGATPVAGAQFGANAAQTVTFAAVAGKTNYLTGVQVSGGGATAAGLVQLTVTGALGGTVTYVVNVPTVGGRVGEILTFNPPLPASGPNVALVVALAAFGAGNGAQALSAQGFAL